MRETILGVIALLFWSSSASFISYLSRLPTFEILTCISFVSFTVIALKLSLTCRWHVIKQPILIWLVGLVGLYGNDILFIAAFKYAPAVHVDLINYLWPLLLILFSGYFLGEKIYAKHVLSALVSFAAITFLIIQDTSQLHFEPQYLFGYSLSLFGALAWTAYALVIRNHGHLPTEMIGMFCGLGGCFALFTHLSFETFVKPTGQEALALIAFGLATHVFAYQLWTIAVERGNIALLSVLSYFLPVLSISLLIFFGHAVMTPTLLCVAVIISTAGIISAIDFSNWRNWLNQLEK